MPPKSPPRSRNKADQLRYREETGRQIRNYITPPSTPRGNPSNPPNAPKKQRRESPSYKKGGIVSKTGLAKLHAGEVVVPVHRVATVKKIMKKM